MSCKYKYVANTTYWGQCDDYYTGPSTVSVLYRTRKEAIAAAKASGSVLDATVERVPVETLKRCSTERAPTRPVMTIITATVPEYTSAAKVVATVPGTNYAPGE